MMAEQAFYWPQGTFEQPNFKHHFVQGEPGGSPITEERFLKVDLPAPIDNTFEFYRLVQLQQGNIPVSNSVYRPFINSTVGAVKFMNAAGTDLKVATTATTPALIPFHNVLTDEATGHTRFYAKPSGGYKDLDSFQFDYGFEGAPNLSAPANVWDSASYHFAWIDMANKDTIPNRTGVTANNGSGQGTGTIQAGLNGINSYRSNSAGTITIAAANRTFDLGTGAWSIGFFLTIPSLANGTVKDLWAQKNQNGTDPGVSLYIESRSGFEGLALRTNDGTATNDTINTLGGVPALDLLRDGKPHYVSIGINNVPLTGKTFHLCIDDVFAVVGDLALNASFVNAARDFTVLGNTSTTGVLDATIENFTMSKSIRTFPDLITTYRDQVITL